MSYDLVINHGRVLTFNQDPNSNQTHDKFVDQVVHIGIQNGKITKISSSPLSGMKEINASHLLIIPGVIDSQVHFRDPGMTQKEDLESGTRSAVLGGVTSVFEMPNTIPATTTEVLFKEKLARAEKCAWSNYAFYIGGSHENIDQLANYEKLPHCSGIKVFMGSSTGTLLVEDDETLEKILSHGSRRVIFHSEDEFRLRDRKKMALDSHDVKMHPIWRDEETALSSTRRLLLLARKTKRPVHVLHVTTAEEMQLLEKNKDIATVEVLPQHLTLSAPECYERLGTLAQQNPPIRDIRHQAALWKALNSGVVDVMGSDHAPHTLQEKAQPYPTSPSGMPGVQTMLPIMLNHIHQGRTTLKKFVELVCENPRRVFGCQSKGRISEGFDADFTIVDLKKQKTITNKWMATKSGWTPFDGMKVTGWPQITIVGGHVVMSDDQLLGAPCGKAVDFTF